MTGRVVAKSDLVLAGLPVALEVLALADPAIVAVPRAADGQRVPSGTVVLDLEGPSHGILLAERVMLNLLQRLSGTATLTRAFVDVLAGTGCRVLDTRKTTPGLKLLEKYAVRCGGGVNHRLTLGDGVLLKENHLAAAGGIRPAVEAARLAAPNLVRIEVEVERLDQLEQCLALDTVDGVLLDNMDLETTRKAVAMRNASGRKVFLEASGNMTLERARPVAETGVDFISVGALTHSAMAADLSLRLDR
jgi:nicotinate-nucleotide pyrophosphorylase (carboxylating)